MRGRPFQTGADARRNTGRTPSAAATRRRILRTLAPEAEAMLSQVVTLARSGDPAALSAFAVLLGSALSQPTDSNEASNG